MEQTTPPEEARHMMQTFELGPQIGLVAPDFSVHDHAQNPKTLDDMMGKRGLLLGFIGDIWQSASIRRIIWLQRHAHSVIVTGYNAALLICDQPHMLFGFYVSSPTPPEFPLLSDMDRKIHRLFNMGPYPGMVLIDHNRIIRHKWLLPDERVWPKIQELVEVLETPANPTD
jgi:peroxiredoxin